MKSQEPNSRPDPAPKVGLFALVYPVLIALAALLASGAPSAAAAEPCPNEALREQQGSKALPDCRAYELVSRFDTPDAEVYTPPLGVKLGGVLTELPMQAAADGEAVAFVGDPSQGGNGSQGGGLGNQYLATRTPGGWASTDLIPLGSKTSTYQAFTPDLSLAILDSSDSPPLAAGAPGDGYDVPYARTSADGIQRPLFTVTPPDRAPANFGAARIGGSQLYTSGDAGPSVRYAGASRDSSHLLFEANDALSAEADEEPPGPTQNDLYDSQEGKLSVVNVLPGQTVSDPGASFGSPEPPASLQQPDFSHAISTDGSRIFWTDLNNGNLYVREDGQRTVEVDEAVGGGGEFQTASADGSLVFFTQGGDLYRYDTETEETTDLASGGQVQGVIGASEDGSYLYIVADAALAAGASPGNCAGYTGGGSSCGLYLYHDGATSFIATLSAIDNSIPGLAGAGNGEFGDWQRGLGNRTAALSPDGHDLIFVSQRSLTGYDNAGLAEVYRYDAPNNHLACISCGPGTGPPPLTGSANSTPGRAAFLTASFRSSTYQPRSISTDGSRAFFDSSEPLVPSDTNGVLDAYEWEAAGQGSCEESSQTYNPASGGCLYLLSAGTAPAPSYFIDASSSGSDVFLATHDQLVRQDRNGNRDLYDIREGGGFPEPLAPICEAESCRANHQEPPAEPAPSTDTNRGPPNSEETPPPKCRAGFLRKHGKCVKKAHRHKKRRRSTAKRRTER